MVTWPDVMAIDAMPAAVEHAAMSCLRFWVVYAAAVEPVPLSEPVKEPVVLAVLSDPGKVNPKAPDALSPGENPEKLTTLGAMELGVHRTVTFRALGVARDMQPLVPKLLDVTALAPVT